MFPVKPSFVPHLEPNLLIDAFRYRVEKMFIPLILLRIKLLNFSNGIIMWPILNPDTLLDLLFDLFYLLTVQCTLTRNDVQFIKNRTIGFLFLDILSEKLRVETTNLFSDFLLDRVYVLVLFRLLNYRVRYRRKQQAFPNLSLLRSWHDMITVRFDLIHHYQLLQKAR